MALEARTRMERDAVLGEVALVTGGGSGTGRASVEMDYELAPGFRVSSVAPIGTAATGTISSDFGLGSRGPTKVAGLL